MQDEGDTEYNWDTQSTRQGARLALSYLRDLLRRAQRRRLTEAELAKASLNFFQISDALELWSELTDVEGVPNADSTPDLPTAATNESEEWVNETERSAAMAGGRSCTGAGDWTRDIPHPADYGSPPTGNSGEVRVASRTRELAPGESCALRETPEEIARRKAAEAERRRLWQVRNRRGVYRPRTVRRYPVRRR